MRATVFMESIRHESEESEDEQPARGNMFANFGMPANETESDDTESEEEVKPEPKWRNKKQKKKA